jgi:spermidine synthase
MLPWVVVDQALTPDGTRLVLARRGDEWEISADGYTLMSSRLHASEEALAHLALESAPRARSLLIGGLGLGYSLRAALDLLPPRARVVVAELSPAVVEWNRTHVASLAGRPLDDPRVRVDIGDVRDAIRKAAGEWDVILLDIDNGPTAIAQASNAGLYDAAGIRSCRTALRPGGVLAVWSTAPDEGYLRWLRQGGFNAAAHPVRARNGRGGRKHVVFVAVARG